MNLMASAVPNSSVWEDMEPDIDWVGMVTTSRAMSKLYFFGIPHTSTFADSSVTTITSAIIILCELILVWGKTDNSWLKFPF